MIKRFVKGDTVKTVIGEDPLHGVVKKVAKDGSWVEVEWSFTVSTKKWVKRMRKDQLAKVV